MVKNAAVLVIDDEVEVGNFFRYLLSPKNYQVNTAHNTRQAMALLAEQEFNLALVDLKLPDGDGISLLRQIKQKQPGCQVIIMTGFGTVQTAVEAIKLGAYDYVDKPFEDINQLENLLEEALKSSADTGPNPDLKGADWTKTVADLGYLLGTNPKMLQLMSLAAKMAKKPLTILIQGETGTGKEMLARFIHAASLRADQTFIPVNCGALTENLLESELFGHEKGAFTGAHTLRRGMFEIANHGTLFLDEIGEASLSTQVKLLRVLETGEYVRVGGEKPQKTDVRIVAATNIYLEQAVAEGRFRTDLLFRLDVVKLQIPPLRERPEDIPLFADYFLAKAGAGTIRGPLTVAPEAMSLLQNYPWPGNVRELANVLAQAAALCDGNVIGLKHLPGKLLRPETRAVERHASGPEYAAPVIAYDSKAQPLPNAGEPIASPNPGDTTEQNLARTETLLRETAAKLVEDINLEDGFDYPLMAQQLKQFETLVSIKLIEKALRQTMGDRKAVADLLNMNSRTLRYLLNEKSKVHNLKS